jgi:pentatricopeptide repeat protein
MSKITFRADEDLKEMLEEQDESKSEAIRSALKLYLGSEMEGLDSDCPPEGYVATKDLQAVHHLGSRGDFDDAEEVIDNYREEGLKLEAALMENFLNSYR